jgi:hypothetical protein
MQAVMLCRFQRLQPNLRVTSTHLRAVVTGLLTSTSDSASNGKERLVARKPLGTGNFLDHLPTADGREIVLIRYTRPAREVCLLWST